MPWEAGSAAPLVEKWIELDLLRGIAASAERVEASRAAGHLATTHHSAGREWLTTQSCAAHSPVS